MHAHYTSAVDGNAVNLNQDVGIHDGGLGGGASRPRQLLPANDLRRRRRRRKRRKRKNYTKIPSAIIFQQRGMGRCTNLESQEQLAHASLHCADDPFQLGANWSQGRNSIGLQHFLLITWGGMQLKILLRKSAPKRRRRSSPGCEEAGAATWVRSPSPNCWTGC